MASLAGLPPLPKSLSNANLKDSSCSAKRTKKHRKHESEGNLPPPPPAPKQPPPPPPRKQTKLDVQLARLRKEMYALRELDLSLLSQMWSLNEALQEYRAMQEMMSPSSDVDDESAIYCNLPPSYHHSSSSSSNNGFTTEL